MRQKKVRLIIINFNASSYDLGGSHVWFGAFTDHRRLAPYVGGRVGIQTGSNQDLKMIVAVLSPFIRITRLSICRILLFLIRNTTSREDMFLIFYPCNYVDLARLRQRFHRNRFGEHFH